MRIVFTGGGTGGHFYPLMAVAEEIRAVCIEKKLLSPQLYYFAKNPMLPNMLVERDIVYKYIPSGKMSGVLGMITSMPNLMLGTIMAFFKLLIIYPDVIFSKGGFDSMPTCIAGVILRIPIILHESDSVPGKANLFIARFATKIAVSFKEAGEYFDIKKTA
ncbi:MAG: glycosyltransferase [Cyanobium sp. MAG06]|nr:glycosyltransferase [Cyanobium sp. MAG06]